MSEIAAPADLERPTIQADRAVHAWVTLVMLGDSYVPGALVMAHSLRTVKTRYAIVCMVTADVSEGARADLALVFDRVVEVPYIEHATKPLLSKKLQNAYHWIQKGFTKWQCLALVEWRRVVFCDADICFVRNADDLFELPAPAGCFSSPWASPYAPDRGIVNPYLEHHRRQVGNQGAADIPHGATVPARLALESLGRPTFTVCTALVVLDTDPGLLRRLRALLAEAPMYGAAHLIGSGADEVAIVEATAGRGQDWTHIHQRYEAVPRKPAWLGEDTFEALERHGGVRAFHYLGSNPWQTSEGEWPDLRVWWDEARRAVAAHPALQDRIEGKRGAPTALDAEFAALQLTRDLQGFLYAAVRGSNRLKYEADLALERWLAAMAAVPGPGLHKKTAPADGLNARLAAELFQKSIVLSSAAGDAMAARMVETVNRRLESTPAATGAAALQRGDRLAFGTQFSAGLGPRLAALLRRFSREDVLRATLRYAAVHETETACGLPQAHFDRLYDELGVRNEAFASPLRARLLGKEGGAFCSPFPDTDAVFGSLGGFFGCRMAARAGGWQVAPPPVAAILDAAADKVAAELKEAAAANRPLTVVFLAPRWADGRCHGVLGASPHLVARVALPRNRYRLETAGGRVFAARYDSVYYGLVSVPGAAAEKGKVGAVLGSVVDGRARDPEWRGRRR